LIDIDLIKHEYIENNIFTIRGTQVMIDYHLADLYGVETKRLNEQVKRNKKRYCQSVGCSGSIFAR
jgi:hypothetical protein